MRKERVAGQIWAKHWANVAKKSMRAADFSRGGLSPFKYEIFAAQV